MWNQFKRMLRRIRRKLGFFFPAPFGRVRRLAASYPSRPPGRTDAAGALHRLRGAGGRGRHPAGDLHHQKEPAAALDPTAGPRRSPRLIPRVSWWWRRSRPILPESEDAGQTYVDEDPLHRRFQHLPHDGLRIHLPFQRHRDRLDGHPDGARHPLCLLEGIQRPGHHSRGGRNFAAAANCADLRHQQHRRLVDRDLYHSYRTALEAINEAYPMPTSSSMRSRRCINTMTIPTSRSRPLTSTTSRWSTSPRRWGSSSSTVPRCSRMRKPLCEGDYHPRRRHPPEQGRHDRAVRLLPHPQLPHRGRPPDPARGDPRAERDPAGSGDHRPAGRAHEAPSSSSEEQTGVRVGVLVSATAAAISPAAPTRPFCPARELQLGRRPRKCRVCVCPLADDGRQRCKPRYQTGVTFTVPESAEPGSTIRLTAVFKVVAATTPNQPPQQPSQPSQPSHPDLYSNHTKHSG